MKYVVEIGQYNSSGNFLDSEWVGILSVVRKIINYFVVYCSQDVYEVFGSLSSSVEIKVIDELGETCGYKAYRVTPKGEQFWLEFQDINFHPDNGISHCYGYDKCDVCIFSLEVEDDINYLIIENAEYLAMVGWTRIDSNKIAIEKKENIEELTDSEDWEILVMNR